VTARRGESGYALVALLATVAIMLILLSAAGPYWKYLMRDDREEELLARGGEIADAIARYQRKNGNALPSSLDVLVKQHFLRHAYKDPMTKDGKWRFLRPGDAMLPGVPGAPGVPAPAGMGGLGGITPTTTTTTTRPSAFSQPSQGIGQGFQGVATTNSDKSLRIFNGRTKYNEWLFVAGQPRLIGRAPTTSPRPGAAQPGSTQPGIAPPANAPAGGTYTPR
jgi:type II secretory pathway pseudopilin PulG